GANVLHLSGPQGLTNLGGTPLAGNSASGDYLVAFNVSGSPAAPSGSGNLVDQEPNNSLAQAQNLGILFPRMQQAGIALVRDFSQAAPGSVADTADYYAFQVTQARLYSFTLTGSGLPTGTAPILTTPTGLPLYTSTVFLNGSTVVTGFLLPGNYVVNVGGWTTTQAQSVAYRLYITIGQIGDNPTPLTVGAAPALSIRLVNSGPPAAPFALPASTTGVAPSGLANGDALPSLVNLLP